LASNGIDRTLVVYLGPTANGSGIIGQFFNHLRRHCCPGLRPAAVQGKVD
jgi:hypothetical protein